MSDDSINFDPENTDGEGAPQAAGPDVEREQTEFEIAFFEGVLERTPDCVEVLQVLGNHYTRVGRTPEGLEVDRRLVRLCPTDALVHYNLACSLSLTDAPADAVRELERAVHLGYRDLRHMDGDSDLDNIRNHPGYLRLVTRLRNG